MIAFPVGIGVFHIVANEIIAKCIKPASNAANKQPQVAANTNGSVTALEPVEAQGRLQFVSAGSEVFAKLSTVFVSLENGNGLHQPLPTIGVNSPAQPLPNPAAEGETQVQ